MSETSKCRERLQPYCKGMGLDIGYGGDPIVPSAITLDLDFPYEKGEPITPQNLKGTCEDLYWFNSSVLDYVYSSHLIEDFPKHKIYSIFWEWVRVVKPEGYIVLYLPDEQRYRAHCEKNQTHRNANHKIDNFSLQVFKNIVGIRHDIYRHMIHEKVKVKIVFYS